MKVMKASFHALCGIEVGSVQQYLELIARKTIGNNFRVE